MGQQGQITLQSMGGLITIFVVVGILMGVGLQVLDQLENNIEGKTIVRSVRDDAQTATLGTNLTLTAASDNNFQSLVGATFNASNFTYFGAGSVLGASNFTVWNDTGIFNATSANATGSLNFSYDYNYLNRTQASISTNESMWALGGFSSWFSIIITVIAAALILGIVFRAFGRSGAP